MFHCWLCGEELKTGMTWCPECAAAQEPPPDVASDVQLVVDGKPVAMVVPVNRKSSRTAALTVA